MKSTIIRIDSTTRTTGIQHLPIVSFSYVAGEARIVNGEVPYNLRFSNVKYCEKRGLQEGKMYLMQWEVVNYPPGLFYTEPTQKITTNFFELDSDPITRAVQIKKLAMLCEGEHELELAAIELTKAKLKSESTVPASEEYHDYHAATSEELGPESDLPF
jgi:hypothetical protein